MTDNQKQSILNMRADGLGYRAIAEQLDLSRDAVRGYCMRNNLAGHAAAAVKNIAAMKGDATICQNCGKCITQTDTGRKRIFCSDKCRRKHWKLTNTTVTAHTNTCVGCGTEFDSSGNKNRRYCSHNCYIKSRFGA